MKKIKDPRAAAVATVWSGWQALQAAKQANDPEWERSAKTYFLDTCTPLIRKWMIQYYEIVPVSNNTVIL